MTNTETSRNQPIDIQIHPDTSHIPGTRDFAKHQLGKIQVLATALKDVAGDLERGAWLFDIDDESDSVSLGLIATAVTRACVALTEELEANGTP